MRNPENCLTNPVPAVVGQKVTLSYMLTVFPFLAFPEPLVPHTVLWITRPVTQRGGGIAVDFPLHSALVAAAWRASQADLWHGCRTGLPCCIHRHPGLPGQVGV